MWKESSGRGERLPREKGKEGELLYYKDSKMGIEYGPLDFIRGREKGEVLVVFTNWICEFLGMPFLFRGVVISF